jgi:hypothetical protein
MTASSYGMMSLQGSYFLRLAGHDFMLKDLALYLVPGMTNEDHKNTSVRITPPDQVLEPETLQI